MCKNKKGIFPIILGIINFALLIPLLCMHFPRIIDSNLGFDYMGVIVGVLSLLVTVLVGWNIFNTLEFKKELEQIKQQLEEKEKTLKELKEEIEKTLKELKEEKEKTLKELKEEIDDNFKEYSCKGYEILADISKEFIITSVPNLKNTGKELSLFNIIRHIVNTICFYEQAGKYKDADDYIDLMVDIIPKTKYDALLPKYKNEIMNKIKTISNPNKLEKYIKLSAYVFTEDKKPSTHEQ